MGWSYGDVLDLQQAAKGWQERQSLEPPHEPLVLSQCAEGGDSHQRQASARSALHSMSADGAEQEAACLATFHGNHERPGFSGAFFCWPARGLRFVLLVLWADLCVVHLELGGAVSICTSLASRR
jgi:hypothetical protein